MFVKIINTSPQLFQLLDVMFFLNNIKTIYGFFENINLVYIYQLERILSLLLNEDNTELGNSSILRLHK